MDSQTRLAKARAALAQAERDLGVRSGPKVAPLTGCGNDRAQLIQTLIKAMGENGYAALVQLPDLCWEGAQVRGLDLDRIICVENAQANLIGVCETLVEGFHVIVFGDVKIPPALQKQLLSRARARGVQILTTGHPWVAHQREVA